jgi:hypothetical protein
MMDAADAGGAVVDLAGPRYSIVDEVRSVATGSFGCTARNSGACAEATGATSFGS